jgi:hypothetical protein
MNFYLFVFANSFQEIDIISYKILYDFLIFQNFIEIKNIVMKLYCCNFEKNQ